MKDKIAIVTGGASGIGKAISLLFTFNEIKLVIVDINDIKANETLSEIKTNGGDAIFIKADVSKPDDNKNVVEQTLNHYGNLHIAINNAGITGPVKMTENYSVSEWDKVISTNLSGVFYGLKHQIPAIQKSGGSIINIASVFGTVGKKMNSAYVAAKHGVIGLTKASALEYADKGIRINSISPGYTLTSLIGNEQYFRKLHPIGRLADPKEIAELALWLTSDKASFITGSNYDIDGGYLAQ